jgi:hypothetical protein
MLLRARSAMLIGATVLLGISWSFALARIRTAAEPYLWAAALPLLLFYLTSGPRPFGIARWAPAGMAAVYVLVLWQVTRPEGTTGALLTLAAAATGAVALWLGSALDARQRRIVGRQARHRRTPGRSAAR